LCQQKNPNLLNGSHLLVLQKNFGTATKYISIFGLAQKIWTSPKYFGPAPNILGPVKGRGMCQTKNYFDTMPVPNFLC
jgi:hypothetical protein